jgi:hypothetical protein
MKSALAKKKVVFVTKSEQELPGRRDEGVLGAHGAQSRQPNHPPNFGGGVV